jgi:hypothetical protein
LIEPSASPVSTLERVDEVIEVDSIEQDAAADAWHGV